MTNDKLAEAITWMEAMQIPRDDRTPDQGKVYRVLKAARLYHDLPVVDVEEFKYKDPGKDEYCQGYNVAIDSLHTIYPQGLKWK